MQAVGLGWKQTVRTCPVAHLTLRWVSELQPAATRIFHEDSDDGEPICSQLWLTVAANSHCLLKTGIPKWPQSGRQLHNDRTKHTRRGSTESALPSRMHRIRGRLHEISGLILKSPACSDRGSNRFRTPLEVPAGVRAASRASGSTAGPPCGFAFGRDGVSVNGVDSGCRLRETSLHSVRGGSGCVHPRYRWCVAELVAEPPRPPLPAPGAGEFEALQLARCAAAGNSSGNRR
jgi:hypothetical protein